MTGPETIIIGAAKFIGNHLLKWGYQKATENKNDEYTQGLYEIIIAATGEYAKTYPITETDRIPFYKSEVLLQEFLKVRFNQELDREKVREEIEKDTRIIPPTPEELSNFFEFFNRAVENSPGIKALDIAVNYKEEIFKISNLLKGFHNELNETISLMKQEIASSHVSAQLIAEWNEQLDESAENLKAFKAKTALQRLENLETRIKSQNITSDTLFAKLYSLQADALGLLQGKDGSGERQAKLNISIYKLNPTNQQYKSNAAFSYFSLREIAKASQMADELLAHDEFNVVGWLVKCFEMESEYQKVLPSIPVSIQKTDIFKLNLYRWVAAKGYIKNYKELEDAGLNITLEINQPLKVSHKNLHFLHLASGYLMNIFFSRYPGIEPRLKFPEAKSNHEYETAAQILELCAEKLRGTEIESDYLYYEFSHHCCRYTLKGEEQDLYQMERIYRLMGDDTEQEVTVRMMQAYNSFESSDFSVKAIEVGEKYLKTHPPSELVLIMMTGTAAAMRDKPKQGEYFLKYLRFQKIIDEHAFFNIISFIRNNVSSLPDHSKKEIGEFVESALYEKSVFKIILQLLCTVAIGIGERTPAEIDQLIEEGRKLAKPSNELLCVQIAFAYVLRNKLTAARDYIKSYEDFNSFNESYVLYCKVLFQMDDGDKLELLSLLKKHREQFPLDYTLLQMELILVQLQGKTKETLKLAKLGHETFSRSEYFVRALFLSLDADLQTEEIRKLKELPAIFNFKDEQTVVAIAQVLIKVEAFSEAIDLLYKYAGDPSNTIVRQSYFMMSHQFPQGAMKEFEEASSGMYVKYEETGGATKIIEITEENKHKHPWNLFIGKKVGETVSYQRPMDRAMDFFKIMRIMDKYLALFESVMQDAEDPLSEMPMKMIKFKGDTVEELHASFIEAFGITGSLEQEQINTELEKYYRGTISFGEVTRSVFRENFIDAYFTLSNNNGKPFRAVSPAIGHSNFGDHPTFVLDVTSLCLFNMLGKKDGMAFSKHFLASAFLRQHIVNELEKTRKEEYKLSVQITMEKVTPHFYDEQFKERRIAMFEGLLEWLDEHCSIADIPERLNFVTALEREKQQDLYFNLYIDNRLLLDRPDHFLLTNDLLYIRHFAANHALALSPVCYLRYYQGDKQKEYTDHMLKHYYVGIPMNAEIMREEFFKMLAGKEHRFTTCLENLKYGWNPDPRNIQEAVSFIKNLYVNAVVNENTRKQWTLAVLQSLVSGMTPRLINLTAMGLQREFRLLGHYETEVLQLFAQVSGN